MSSGPLHILQVGAGFRPFRKGGLIAYSEDLMDALAARGHTVTYLFSGRFYPFMRRPRLKRWSRGPIAMLEIVNSPSHDHGRQPEIELSDPMIERMVERAVRAVAPDVVHVQELAGLPTSTLDIVRATGVPIVMTLNDYYPLCPAFRLVAPSGRSCLDHSPGEACAAVMAEELRPSRILYDATVRYELDRRLPLRRFPRQRGRLIRGIVGTTKSGSPGRSPRASDIAFQRRRDVNVERLNRLDALVAVSSRVAQLYTDLGVDEARMRVSQMALRHIEHLRSEVVRPSSPVVFATLTGGESHSKGAHLIVEVARRLSVERPERFRIVVCGRANDAMVQAARTVPGLELWGAFGPDELDDLLGEFDVGVMPSVWEEAYGLQGVEFMARGRPVIANAIGGMVDFVRPGETGWLNRSCSAEELCTIMRGLIDNPAEIETLSKRIVAHREEIIMPLSQHVSSIEALYREVMQATA